MHATSVIASLLALLVGVSATIVSAGESDGPAAHYARVTLLGKGVLHLAEVQVFSGRSNVALRGKASQASTAYGGPARLANDGNRNGHFSKARSTSHTGEARNPWWEVDLGKAMPIDRIVIWNRTDSPEVRNRLNRYRIELLDAQRKMIWKAEGRKPPNPSATFTTDVHHRLINRTVPHDTVRKGVFVLDEPIAAPGRLTDFSIFDNDKSKLPGYVTPLVLRQNGSRWRVVAIGEACRSDASGVQRFPFVTWAGQVPRVKAGDRFGWRDGELGSDSIGAIDFDTSGATTNVIYLGNKEDSFGVNHEFNEVERFKRVYSVLPHVVPNSDPDGYRQRLGSVWFERYEHLSEAAERDGRARVELESIKAEPGLMKLIDRSLGQKRAATLFDGTLLHMKMGLLDEANASLKKILREYPLSRAAQKAKEVEPKLMELIRRSSNEKQAKSLFEKAKLHLKEGLLDEAHVALKKILREYPETRVAHDARSVLKAEKLNSGFLE